MAYLREDTAPLSDRALQAQIIANQRQALKEKDELIAQLRKESRYKTAPAQRKAQQKYDDKHRDKKRARMREYMRAKRAESRAKKESI